MSWKADFMNLGSQARDLPGPPHELLRLKWTGGSVAVGKGTVPPLQGGENFGNPDTRACVRAAHSSPGYYMQVFSPPQERQNTEQ